MSTQIDMHLEFDVDIEQYNSLQKMLDLRFFVKLLGIEFANEINFVESVYEYDLGCFISALRRGVECRLTNILGDAVIETRCSNGVFSVRLFIQRKFICPEAGEMVVSYAAKLNADSHQRFVGRFVPLEVFC